MNASSRRILRLGITAGLSLGAIVGLVGCAEQSDDAGAIEAAAVESANGFTLNGFTINGFTLNGFSLNGFTLNGMSLNGFTLNGMSMNGMSMNGFALNGMTMNGMTINGLEVAGGGLSSTNGLMTTDGGREIVKYMVKCAYPANTTFTAYNGSTRYDFPGSLGVAPELKTGCDTACQERVSACMLAHVNNSGLHVGIWLVGPDSGIGWGYSPNYPFKEGAYFGNLFQNMSGLYCAGKDMGSGDAKGRLGSPFGNNGSVLKAAFGEQYDAATAQNVPQYCYNPANPSQSCTLMNEGYSSCPDISGTHGGPWTHPVTVWRNFESTQLYKICNKQTGRCLGTVGGSTAEGANIEQRAFNFAAGQTWQILQVNPGLYKVVNKTSGKVLDASATQVVQKAYTGAASQQMPIQYFSDAPGFANLKMASNTANVFYPDTSVYWGDGATIKTRTNATADDSKWYFIAVDLAVFDPGAVSRLVPQNATGLSIDIPNGSTAPGTIAQIYSSWGTDFQRFYIQNTANGNVRIKMKAQNYCLGLLGNSTTAGTKIEVQPCDGRNGQSWSSAETYAGSGVVVLKNYATTNLCLDVVGSGNYNGAQLDAWYCDGSKMNQRFATVAAP